MVALRFLVWLGATSIAIAAQAQALPTQFVHDRIYLLVPAPDGSSLRVYTDSGGGWNAIRKSVADRLKLEKIGDTEVAGSKATIVRFPSFFEQAGIPAPAIEGWLKGGLVAVPDAQLREDAFLGNRWFAGRIWRIDYARQSLAALSALPPAVGERTALGFRADASGKRDLDFPRISITVDGDPLDVLLDTGATGQVTASSAPILGLTVGTKIGVSYITETTFAHWTRRHPEWRTIESAEAVTGHAFPMIEVLSLTIAGIAVGPVWFAQRPDSAFRIEMSQWMDRPIEGAIGGSALKYFRIVLDYPAATAYFEKADGTAVHRQ